MCCQLSANNSEAESTRYHVVVGYGVSLCGLSPFGGISHPLPTLGDSPDFQRGCAGFPILSPVFRALSKNGSRPDLVVLSPLLTL